jgi:hypothetical protein
MTRIIRLPKGSSAAGIVDSVPPPTVLGKHVRPQTGSGIAAETPPIGWARLTAVDNSRLSILCELGPGVPRVTQGYAEWQETDRPNNISFTRWTGYKPISVELALELDDLTNDRSVEDAVTILEALAGRGRVRPGHGSFDYLQPPQISVNTAGVMPYDEHNFPGMRWVVNGLDWDDEDAITNDHGNRVRAPVTVTLLQYIDNDRLESRALTARKRLRAQRPARHNYTVRDGDTAMTIARRELGDPGRYQEILRLNGLRDPRALRRGAVIKLPG